MNPECIDSRAFLPLHNRLRYDKIPAGLTGKGFLNIPWNQSLAPITVRSPNLPGEVHEASVNFWTPLIIQHKIQMYVLKQKK